jgi:hypothetical protein
MKRTDLSTAISSAVSERRGVVALENGSNEDGLR